MSPAGNLQQVPQGRTLGGVAEEYYSASEAAKLLGISGARVRQLLKSGELEGEQDPLSDRWRVSRAAVHARREERGVGQPSARLAPADPTPWVDRIAELQYRLGHVEGRLQITEHAESTLREQLDRERARADQERERVEQLQAELDRERGRGFWSRLWGG